MLRLLGDRGGSWQMWVTMPLPDRATSTRPPGTRFVPADRTDLHTLLGAYVLDKALYEVRYELNHRPDWAAIPLRGVTQILGRTTAATAETPAP